MRLSPETDERTIAPSLEKLLQVVPSSGGTVDKVDIWGKRRLAYDIKKKSEGFYVVVDMTTTPEIAQELDRQLGLNETVLRTSCCAPRPEIRAGNGETSHGRRHRYYDHWELDCGPRDALHPLRGGSGLVHYRLDAAHLRPSGTGVARWGDLVHALFHLA